MIIDFHTHVFPPEMRRSREKYFSGEPDFKLLYESPKARLAGAEEIILAMDEQSVDMSVILGFPWKSQDLIRRHNDYLMDAVAEFPNRLRGMACFDPLSDIAFQEAERCLDGGLFGVGELAFYRSPIDAEAVERLRPLMELCRDRNTPVLFHANEPVGHSYPGKAPGSLRGIYELIKAFPENAIILAHWGGGLPFYLLLKKEVGQALKNVFFDTAASPFLYHPRIYSLALEIAGADKILFGSDYPLIKPEVYFREMAAAGLSEKETAMICGKNAAALLN